MFLVFELKLHAVHIFCIHVVFYKLPYLTVEKKSNNISWSFFIKLQKKRTIYLKKHTNYTVLFLNFRLKSKHLTDKNMKFIQLNHI